MSQFTRATSAGMSDWQKKHLCGQDNCTTRLAPPLNSVLMLVGDSEGTDLVVSSRRGTSLRLVTGIALGIKGLSNPTLIIKMGLREHRGDIEPWPWDSRLNAVYRLTRRWLTVQKKITVNFKWCCSTEHQIRGTNH